MAKDPEKKWTSDEIVSLLKLRFCPPEYATFEQVAQGTGMYARSWIDVASFNLWPSKSLRRSAFEIKVSRQDFVNEIQNPNKNDWVKDSFHEFWYVTAPKVVKNESEIPENCGWMQATKGGLRIKLHAKVKEDAEMSETFFASLCRSAVSEVEKAKRNIKESILSEDMGYQQAQAWEEAGRRFLLSRGVGRWLDNDPDEIFQQFEEATVDVQARKDREHILNVLGSFQDKMVTLGDLFSVLGAVSLLEKDELGKHLISTWGGEDTSSLAYQRAEDMRKKGKRRVSDYVKLTERLLERVKGITDLH